LAAAVKEPCRPPAAGLRRKLGLREAVALGMGGTVGGGIFVLVGTAVALAGPAALVAFLVAFAAALVIALPYAELSCRLPLAGGGYAFARRVLGPHWASSWAGVTGAPTSSSPAMRPSALAATFGP
jgi:amino acid transporter